MKNLIAHLVEEMRAMWYILTDHGYDMVFSTPDCNMEMGDFRD